VTRCTPPAVLPGAVFLVCLQIALTGFAGDIRYFDEFDPQRIPWAPAEERNLEEVFKNYRYFSIQEERERLTVTEYLQGKPVSVKTYRTDPQGQLQELEPEVQSAVPVSGASLYTQHCASCHSGDRLGAIGPALLPGNLERLKREDAKSVIRDGRVATQMPAFAGILDDTQIVSLADFIYTPSSDLPAWDAGRIQDSWQVLHAPGSLPDKPVFDADPLNLFMVVEAGDHHITVLDGDRFEPLHRFPTRYALHGGVKFSPDGRYAYLASRDGWVSKFDIYNLKTVAEIRTGINTRNVAVSGDGSTLMVANYLPETLVVLDAADLRLLKVIPAIDSAGKASRVSAVYQAAPRGSFVAALKDVPELWEIGVARPGFPVRRIPLERPLDDFFFDQDYRIVIGADRAQHGGQVVELDSGKVLAQLPLNGMPHLGSGTTWQYQGRPVLATPNLGIGEITVIDMQNWEVIRRIPMPGPGFFMRSHENTPYAWADVFSGPDRDVIEVIDKRTLEPVKALRPAPGKTSAHVEFTRDGRYALVSIWELDGALVVYDADTLQEVKRIPMRKPSGKYNVYNKISRSEGTSH
jgi:mono/diheme cytochrome c family protein/DNA-binding beta-propeller fold protein YncE